MYAGFKLSRVDELNVGRVCKHSNEDTQTTIKLYQNAPGCCKYCKYIPYDCIMNIFLYDLYGEKYIVYCIFLI